MGFWSKLFGKKDEEKPADETMENPAAAEETAEVSEEEKTEE